MAVLINRRFLPNASHGQRQQIGCMLRGVETGSPVRPTREGLAGDSRARYEALAGIGSRANRKIIIHPQQSIKHPFRARWKMDDRGERRGEEAREGPGKEQVSEVTGESRPITGPPNAD